MTDTSKDGDTQLRKFFPVPGVLPADYFLWPEFQRPSPPVYLNWADFRALAEHMRRQQQRPYDADDGR